MSIPEPPFEILSGEQVAEVKRVAGERAPKYPFGKSDGLTAFQQRVFAYFTCYTFASRGLTHVIDSLPAPTSPDQHIIIGEGPPEEGVALARLKLVDVIEHASKDGLYADTIAQALLLRIYAEWDERYRHDIAREFRVQATHVRSDLMGDLRRVRHWIAHGKSVVGSDVDRLKTLNWGLTAGQPLIVTKTAMGTFMAAVNQMLVSITWE